MIRPISYPLAVGSGITRVVEAASGDHMMLCVHGTAASYLGSSLDDHVIGAGLANLAQRVPTLIAWGDADRSVPIQTGHEARMVVKAARFAVLHGAAHVPQYELPKAFAQVVEAFLTGSEPEIEDAHFE